MWKAHKEGLQLLMFVRRCKMCNNVHRYCDLIRAIIHKQYCMHNGSICSLKTSIQYIENNFIPYLCDCAHLAAAYADLCLYSAHILPVPGPGPSWTMDLLSNTDHSSTSQVHRLSNTLRISISFKCCIDIEFKWHNFQANKSMIKVEWKTLSYSQRDCTSAIILSCMTRMQ